VLDVTVSPDGGTCVTARADGALDVWDIPTGGAVRSLRGHQGEVRGVAYSGDGALLASVGQDGTLRLWRAADAEAVAVAEAPGSLDTVAFRPDGRIVAAAGEVAIVLLRPADLARVILVQEGPDLWLAFTEAGVWEANDLEGGKALIDWCVPVLAANGARFQSCAPRGSRGWSSGLLRRFFEGGPLEVGEGGL
jgi:hypothetical protein